MFTCKKLYIRTDRKTLVNISFSFKNSFALIKKSKSEKSLTLEGLCKSIAIIKEVISNPKVLIYSEFKNRKFRL